MLFLILGVGIIHMLDTYFLKKVSKYFSEDPPREVDRSALKRTVETMNVFTSARDILKKFPKESDQVSLMIKIGQGLLAMEVKYATFFGEENSKKVFHVAQTEEELREKFNTKSIFKGLSVQLSEKLLEELTTPEPESQPDLYMFNHTPFPVFARLKMDPQADTYLMGLTKVMDTKDPVSMEDLQFPGIDQWKMFYDRLKPVCVAACTNGHAMSFDTMCNFMREDGWDREECHNIVKVKCPTCRKRFEIHEMLPMLCSVFIPLAEAESEKAADKRSKEDKIQTYFSTFDDEEDDEELEELRMMVRREEEETTGEGDDDEEEDDDYDPDEDDEEDEDTTVEEEI